MSDTSIPPADEPRHPFLRAYRSLRFDLAAGTRPPGDQIMVGAVAKSLGISPTPVREALARLVGERLVEDRRSHGYFVPLPSWFDLIELYDICALHLEAALLQIKRKPDRAAAPGLDLQGLPESKTDPMGELHLALLLQSTNSRLVAAGRIHLEALAAARRVEVDLFGVEEGRVRCYRDRLEGGAWQPIRSSLQSEFRLRRARAEPVAFAMAAAYRARNSPHIV